MSDPDQAIRQQLRARVDAIGIAAPRLSPNNIAAELEGVRRIAKAHGIVPAVAVIHVLDSALARGERGALVHGWLAILKDAIAAPADPRTRDVLTAACSVRLAG